MCPPVRPSQRHWLRPFLLVCLLGALAGGCASKKELPKTIIGFHFQTLDLQGGRTLTMPISGLQYRYVGDSGLTEADLDDVQLVHVDLGYCLMFQFNDDGIKDLYRQTVTHQGLLLFTFTNDHVIGATPISAPISDGRLFTFVEVPDDKLGDLVLDLQDSIKKIKALKDHSN